MKTTPSATATAAISQATRRTWLSSGLGSWVTRSDSAAIRPSSVAMPVAKTTPWASPPVQLVPLKTRSRAVSRGTSTSREEAERSAGTDSPVSADMSTSIAPERRRTSAAIRSPSSSATTSPGTSSTASISRDSPSRIARARCGMNCARASTARSACTSCTEGEGGVEHDDQEHRDRHLRRADEDQQQGGDPQQEGQRVRELAGQLARPTPPASPVQLVRPVLGESPLPPRRWTGPAASCAGSAAAGSRPPRGPAPAAPPTPRAGFSPRRPVAHRRGSHAIGEKPNPVLGNTPMTRPAKAQRMARQRCP